MRYPEKAEQRHTGVKMLPDPQLFILDIVRSHILFFHLKTVNIRDDQEFKKC